MANEFVDELGQIIKDANMTDKEVVSTTMGSLSNVATWMVVNGEIVPEELNAKLLALASLMNELADRFSENKGLVWAD